jgi:acylphosphatase
MSTKRVSTPPHCTRSFLLTLTPLSSRQKISYKVEGTVQGVFFRKFTAKQAKSLAITGFVENASDGSVVGEAQGSDDAIQEFVKHLGEGPSAARVSKVDHEDVEAKSGETGFGQR